MTEEITRIEILTVYVLTDESPRTRKIQFEKEKSKIRCLWIQLNFIQGLIEFYRGFDCKKIDFLSQFRLLLEEIKVLGSNYNFEELIWSN